MKNIILLVFVVLLHSCDSQSDKQNVKHPSISGTPLLWGFDDAGTGAREVPTSSVMKSVIEEFGFDLAIHHYYPFESYNKNISVLASLHDFYSSLSADWIINVEHANFVKSFVDETGKDWYNHPDGRHFFLFPDEILQVLSGLENKPGIMYDEPEHMQNCRNSVTIRDFEAPFFLTEEKAGSLEQASTRFTEAARKIAQYHENYGLQLYTEHVFPIMFHNFGKAGFIPVSKILKESVSPAFIACAMGAAIQYNKPFWLTPDLHFAGRPYPGHSTDAYRSALLLAYHMGAECIYTENLSHDHRGEGRGSLIVMNKERDGYELTEFGEVAKWFRWAYAPENPRYYSFRDLIPRVAIIRQEDATWGQSDSFLPDWLFGVKEWQSTPVTEAWFQIWHLLSNGKISSHSFSWINRKVIREMPEYQVFFPLDGVVVFDENVGMEHLKDVELIFLTGIGVSESTLDAVKLLVLEGAVCVGLPHLVPDEVREKTGDLGILPDGNGKWIVSESFMDETVKQHIESFLPEENYIRYRFGETEVQIRPINQNPNNISVEILSSSQ